MVGVAVGFGVGRGVLVGRRVAVGCGVAVGRRVGVGVSVKGGLGVAVGDCTGAVGNSDRKPDSAAVAGVTVGTGTVAGAARVNSAATEACMSTGSGASRVMQAIAAVNKTVSKVQSPAIPIV